MRVEETERMIGMTLCFLEIQPSLSLIGSVALPSTASVGLHTSTTTTLKLSESKGFIGLHIVHSFESSTEPRNTQMIISVTITHLGNCNTVEIDATGRSIRDG